VPQITLIETFAKLGGKAFSKVGEQALAICGAGGFSLLELNDVLSHHAAELRSIAIKNQNSKSA